MLKTSTLKPIFSIVAAAIAVFFVVVSSAAGSLTTEKLAGGGFAIVVAIIGIARLPQYRATLIQLAFIVVAAVVVFGFVSAAKSDQARTSCTAFCALRPAYAGRDRRAPDFELPDLDGNRVKLSSFRGKVVFLNFWTETCGPCKEEMPSVAMLAKVAKTRTDMVVLTVTIDEDRQKVRDLLSVLLNGDVPFPVLFDEDSQIVGGKYGTKLFPETWVIDPDGIIRARFDGARNWSEPLAVEIGEMVKRPAGKLLDFGCPVDFALGQPRGSHAALCVDDS